MRLGIGPDVASLPSLPTRVRDDRRISLFALYGCVSTSCACAFAPLSAWRIWRAAEYIMHSSAGFDPELPVSKGKGKVLQVHQDT